jgi:hypothetical protein
MYKEINGTSYHEQTPKEICEVLEYARKTRTRIKIDLGYTNPNDIGKGKRLGESWGEIYDVTGYVGRSGGNTKIPILLYNSRSLGGGGMLDHCIVQIKESKGGKVLYQHENYLPYSEK